MTVSFFVLNLFNTLAMVYGASKLLESKIDFKSKKIYIVLIVVSLYSFFAYFITKSILRIVILFQILNVCYIYLFHSDRNNMPKITFVSTVCWILLTLSEVIVALGLNLIFKLFINLDKINAYNNNLVGYAIIFFFVIIVSIKPLQKIIIKIINSTNIYKIRNFLFCIVYIFLILITTLYLIYFDLSQPLKLVLLILMLFEYIYLTSFMIISYKNKEKVQKELDLMLEVTSKYEDVINKIKTKNHENKNQLIIVKDLIGSDNKKALQYLDAMVKTNYEDDDELMLKVVDIPSGGLKGLIYYKLLTMKSKGIYCYLDSIKTIDKKIFEKIDLATLQSFYKIIGVLIDNAIEAVEIYNGKKKIILIELFIDNENLIFSVSNEYQGKIDFEHLGNHRITSKGEDHGYGLQLVKDLTSSNKDIFHQTEIVGNLFVQKVGIKIIK